MFTACVQVIERYLTHEERAQAVGQTPLMEFDDFVSSVFASNDDEATSAAVAYLRVVWSHVASGRASE